MPKIDHEEEPFLPIAIPEGQDPGGHLASIPVRCNHYGCNAPLLYETEKARGSCDPCFDAESPA